MALKQEIISHSDDEQAILGFVIPENALSVFLKEIDKVLQGRPFAYATKKDNGQLKVKIWGVSFSSAEKLASQLSDFNPSQVIQASLGTSSASFDFLDD